MRERKNKTKTQQKATKMHCVKYRNILIFMVTPLKHEKNEYNAASIFVPRHSLIFGRFTTNDQKSNLIECLGPTSKFNIFVGPQSATN